MPQSELLTLKVAYTIYLSAATGRPGRDGLVLWVPPVERRTGNDIKKMS